MTPTLNVWSLATQHPSVPSAEESWIGLLGSQDSIDSMFCDSTSLAGNCRQEGMVRWAGLEGNEGMKSRRRKMSKFFSEDRRLPSTRRGDYICRDILTSLSLLITAGMQLFQRFIIYYQVSSQDFTSTVHCRRGRTYVSFFKTWAKSHLLYDSFWDWPISFLSFPLNMKTCLPC